MDFQPLQSDLPHLTRSPISTAHLVLRAFCPEDAGDLFAYLSNPNIYRYEPGEPLDREKAQAQAIDMSSSPDFWAIELQVERKMIGQLYFHHIQPLDLMTWELGYILNPNYQRLGYASEAAYALVAYGFRTLQAHRVVANCNPENTASWKLLEKIGFRREALLRQAIFFRKNAAGAPLWTDTFVYATLADEW